MKSITRGGWTKANGNSFIAMILNKYLSWISMRKSSSVSSALSTNSEISRWIFSKFSVDESVENELIECWMKLIEEETEMYQELTDNLLRWVVREWWSQQLNSFCGWMMMRPGETTPVMTRIINIFYLSVTSSNKTVSTLMMLSVTPLITMFK